MSLPNFSHQISYNRLHMPLPNFSHQLPHNRLHAQLPHNRLHTQSPHSHMAQVPDHPVSRNFFPARESLNTYIPLENV